METAQTESPTLATILDECGMTEIDLAKKIGASQPAVSRWIHGRNYPGTEYIVLIAKATGRPVRQIIEAVGIDCSGIPYDMHNITDAESGWQIKKKAILSLLRGVIRQIERI